ncbi:ABC transporter substrate-binding protein [Paenibacillus sp. strain BS8-2]
MLKRKTIYPLLSMILASTVMMTACSSNGNNTETTNTGNNGGKPSNATVEKTEAPKEVSFTIGYAPGDPAGRQAMSDMINKFSEANPHIKLVDITDTGSGSYLDWLKTKDAVGEYPDLVELRNVQVFVDAGRVAELPEDLHDLFDSLPELDGKRYVAPMTSTTPLGVIYSKKAYADAGITDLPKTYDEFLEVQEKLKATGISPFVVGGKDVWHMNFWINRFLIEYVYAPDADWNSKKNAKEVSFTDANVVQAMTDYKELFSNYVDKGWLSTADNQTVSVLISGKAAQLYSGPWMFGQITEADPSFEFGYYALPNKEGKIVTNGMPSLAGWSLSAEASKDADKVDAIKQFIRFYFAPENYGPLLEAVNGLPSIAEPIELEVSEQFQEVLKVVNDPAVTKSMGMQNWWGKNQIPTQFRDYFFKLMQEMVLKDGDVLEYMKLADKEYDSMVEANSK